MGAQKSFLSCPQPHTHNHSGEGLEFKPALREVKALRRLSGLLVGEKRGNEGDYGEGVWLMDSMK
jgi:hypothetical protein